MSDGSATPWPEPQIISEFRRAFDTERERRQRALAALVGQGTRNNVLLVMMANRGYNDLFNNWVRSCDDNGLNVRGWSMLFAADEEAAAAAGTRPATVRYAQAQNGSLAGFGALGITRR